MEILISLGPALLFLTQGDIQSFAEHLRIAFGATVTGLFAATLGYVFTQQQFFRKQ
jgi:biopolymer transport protein ExbB/TolQ